MTVELDVSVIIPSYEAADFIGDSIRACLNQTGITFEVIVVDDGSQVSSAQAVADASGGDPRIQFIQMPENQGPSVARNVAIQHARGRYIAVLDADDEMSSGRLAVMVAAADESGADIIVDQMEYAKFGQEEGDRQLFLKEFGPIPVEIDMFTYVDPNSVEKFGRPLGYLKPLFRSEYVRENCIKYDPALRNSEDYYLVADMLATGARMLLLPYSGYVYKIREGSLSHRLGQQNAIAIVEAEKMFADKYAETLSDEVKSILGQRLSQVQKTASFEALVDALKCKSIINTGRVFLSKPRHTPWLLWRLFSIVLKKLPTQSIVPSS